MRPRDNENDHQPKDWLTWFRQVVSQRGYDIDSPRGGGSTRLAFDTGLAPASVSRILAGSVPSYESSAILARTLGIPLRTLLIRTGKATEDDFPRVEHHADPIAVLSGNALSPAEVAIVAGVPKEDRDWFETMVRRLRGETDEGGTAGGVAAER
jgi:transcriptional regulator with XRE-family HTH domain